VAGTPPPAETAALEASLIEQELEAMERSVAPRPPGWAWILVVLGFVLSIGLAAHATTAYLTIDRLNQKAAIATSNPVQLLQDVSNTGPRVPSAVESTSRNAYAQALTQYVLDGTGVCLGLALAFAGLFIRVNR
jgi:hypothetical protein